MKDFKKIALFDFDGTITYRDSLFEFIIFYRGSFRFYWGMFLLSPLLFLHKLGIIGAQKAKERVLTFFFKDEPVNFFVNKATDFSINKIPEIIKPSALKEINLLKNKGVEIYIVSASINLWLSPWCDQMKVGLISSELEIKNNCITGKLVGNNCTGPEKAIRIKNTLKDIDHTIELAYGDSAGDKEMLMLAKQQFYKSFI